VTKHSALAIRSADISAALSLFVAVESADSIDPRAAQDPQRHERLLVDRDVYSALVLLARYTEPCRAFVGLVRRG
jgi:hypothetical protein